MIKRKELELYKKSNLILKITFFIFSKSEKNKQNFTKMLYNFWGISGGFSPQITHINLKNY